jgi:hypothetical protein
MFDLADTREGFTDAGARDAWMTDPVLVPVRENIDRRDTKGTCRCPWPC